MAKTPHYQLPYPDPGQGEGWQEMFEQAMLGLDSQMYNNQVSLDEAIGVRGVADSELTPYTMIGVGKMWPGAQPIFGPFTINGVIDEWFLALKNMMNGQVAFPIRLPELAYCNPTSAAKGASVAGVSGPVVRLKNDSVRTAVVNAPVYLSNEGGVVPAEPFTTQYPLILPRTGNVVGLRHYTSNEYACQKTNQDLVVPQPDGIQSFTGGAASKTYGMGSYRGAYFEYTNFRKDTKLVLRGLANGTFRIYGLTTAGAVVNEDVVFTGHGAGEEHKTVREDWDQILGISFRGIDLAPNTAFVWAKDAVVTVEVRSEGVEQYITDLRAFRYAVQAIPLPGPDGDYGTYGEYPPEGSENWIDYDKFVSPDPLFRVAWECVDMGWLWDTSHNVAGVPFVMLGMGLRENRIAFLHENLANTPDLTGEGASAIVRELMTTGLAAIPATPKPMYILGYDKGGMAKVWTITPKLVFTTVNNRAYDGPWYNGSSDDLAVTADGDWPTTGMVPEPYHGPAEPTTPGTSLIYRYEFPTDLAVLTQVLWANADPILQYSKMFGAAVALPIGRVLAPTPAGQPAPVRLWTQNVVDNAAKFNVLIDWLIGYGTGNVTGQRLAQQVQYIGQTLGFSEREVHQIVQGLPLLLGLLGFYLWSSSGGLVSMDFTIVAGTSETEPGKNLLATINSLTISSLITQQVSEFRIYFGIPEGEAEAYFAGASLDNPNDRWSHFFDDQWNRSFVSYPFVNGEPAFNSLYFKGAGNVFLGVLVFGDVLNHAQRVMVPVFPSNGAIYPGAQTRPTTMVSPCYINELDDLGDDVHHILAFAPTMIVDFQYGLDMVICTTNMANYGVNIIADCLDGGHYEMSWAGTIGTHGIGQIENTCNLRPDPPNPLPTGSITQMMPYVFPMAAGDTIHYYIVVDGPSTPVLDWAHVYSEETPNNSNAPSWDYIHGGATSTVDLQGMLGACGIFVSLFYLLWLMSPSALGVTLLMSIFGLGTSFQGILNTGLGQLGLSVSGNPLKSSLAYLRGLFGFGS